MWSLAKHDLEAIWSGRLENEASNFSSVHGFIEQVIKESKTQLSSINPLTIHWASRDTFLLTNKYQFICIIC